MSEIIEAIKKEAVKIQPECGIRNTVDDCSIAILFEGDKTEEANKLRHFFGDSIAKDDIFFNISGGYIYAYFLIY